MVLQPCNVDKSQESMNMLQGMLPGPSGQQQMQQQQQQQQLGQPQMGMPSTSMGHTGMMQGGVMQPRPPFQTYSPGTSMRQVAPSMMVCYPTLFLISNILFWTISVVIIGSESRISHAARNAASTGTGKLLCNVYIFFGGDDVAGNTTPTMTICYFLFWNHKFFIAWLFCSSWVHLRWWGTCELSPHLIKPTLDSP